MYKENHLWIRMPEVWEKGVTKKRFCFWESQQQSDECQKIILGKVFDLIGLDISKAIQLKRQYYANRNAVSTT